MDELGEKVRVVYHKEFMPGWALPTFNSCSIEMFLHRIPGLSERFLYGNDDMFPVSPLTEEDFFEGYTPCLHHMEKPMPAEMNIFHLICRNGENLVGKEFGRQFNDTIIRGGHSITPMLKSTWEHLWQLHGKAIERSISPFRNGNNILQWICPWWHYMAGKYVDRVPQRIYVSVRTPLEDVKKTLRESSGIVCVNDHECERDYMKYGRAVSQVLRERLE
jgi:hypothetical protein